MFSVVTAVVMQIDKEREGDLDSLTDILVFLPASDWMSRFGKH